MTAALEEPAWGLTGHGLPLAVFAAWRRAFSRCSCLFDDGGLFC